MIQKTICSIMSCIILFAATTLSAQNLLHHIPEDASFVLSIDPANLNSKVSFDKIKTYAFYQDMLGSMTKMLGPGMSDKMVDVINNPGNYGMDFMSKSYGFGQITNDGSFFGALFKLNDAPKFENFFKEMTMGMLPIEARDNFNVVSMGSKGAFAWNNEMAMLLTAEISFEDTGEEGALQKHNEKVTMEISSRLSTALKGGLSKNITTNSGFAKTQTQRNDAAFWFDYEWITKLGGMNSLPAGTFDDMAPFMEMFTGLYKDMDINVALNFNKGTMSMDIDSYTSPRFQRLGAKSFDAKVNKKMGKYITQDDLLGYYAVALNVKNMVGGYKDLLIEMASGIPQYGHMAKDIVDIIDIAIDQEAIYNLLKGDMVLAITGIQEYEKLSTVFEFDEDFNRVEVEKMTKQKIPTFMMMMSYGNKNDIMKFIRLGEKASVLKSTGKSYIINVPDIPMEVHLALHDGILFVTNNLDLINNKLQKGYPKKQRLAKKHCKAMQENGYIIFWDIPQTIDFAAKMGAPVDVMVDRDKQPVESFVMKMPKDEKSMKTLRQNFSFNFVNKNINALEQILNFADEMYLKMGGGKSM